MTKPRFHLFERVCRVGRTLPIHLQRLDKEPSDIRVLLWHCVRPLRGGKLTMKLIHNGPLDELANPYRFRPAKKGMHTLMLLAWDGEDPPSKKQPHHLSQYHLTIRVE